MVVFGLFLEADSPICHDRSPTDPDQRTQTKPSHVRQNRVFDSAKRHGRERGLLRRLDNQIDQKLGRMGNLGKLFSGPAIDIVTQTIAVPATAANFLGSLNPVDKGLNVWHKYASWSATRAGLDPGLPLSLLRSVQIHRPLRPSQAGSDGPAVGRQMNSFAGAAAWIEKGDVV